MHPNTSLSSNIDSQSHNYDRILLFRHLHVLELVLAALVFFIINSLRQKKHHGLPIWPILGMVPSLLLALRSNVYEWLTDVLIRQNGTFRFIGPSLSSLNAVVTADPRNLEYILKTSFSNFPKGPYFRDNFNDLLGDGIFSADDATWLLQRKTASLEFHSAKFRHMTVDSLAELVHSRLIPVLEETDSSPTDLQDVLLRLTFDNVCMIAFGVDPGCLRVGLPEKPFARAFEDATEATVARFVTPTFVWKAMRYLHVGPERKLRHSIKGVDAFADDVIRTRKRELQAQSHVGRSDMLTTFMGLTDQKGEAFSDKFLRDICVNFILAGRDTSSVALTWFFWLIDRNPQVEDKIMAEICRIVGERGDLNHNKDLIFTPEEVKKMDYLHAALSETLRLYPSVPVDHKEALNDDVLPDGTMVKKGTKVLYAIYAMGRMEGIWGKDCRKFRPEAWLRDGRFIGESAYKFTAFNGGPRLCLGKDLAYYQMKFVAASVLYRFKVKVVENQCVEPKLALTMYMKHGLKVNLLRRDHLDQQSNIINRN